MGSKVFSVKIVASHSRRVINAQEVRDSLRPEDILILTGHPHTPLGPDSRATVRDAEVYLNLASRVIHPAAPFSPTLD